MSLLYQLRARTTKRDAFHSFYFHLTYNSHFSKKTAMSLKEIFNGKKFSNSIYSFKNTFWTILNRFRPKKNFEKFSNLCHFLPFLGPKYQFLELFGGEILKNVFTRFKKIVLRSIRAIARILTPIQLCRLTRFVEVLTKNRGLSKILGSKKIFRFFFTKILEIILWIF